MRKQFVKTVESLLEQNPKLVLLLGDIGVFGFRNAFDKLPQRVYNIGILEQASISLAAGLAMTGFIPIFHSIAPFVAERAFEQLKDDFGYQKLGGNFVSVGASYDYAALGGTHHCPGDVGVLLQIPGMEIAVPGTPEEFDVLFRQSYSNGNPTYFRLSEKSNTVSQKAEFGKATVIKTGKKATVIAVGPMLEAAAGACEGLDVSLLYYTTIAPFDEESLRQNSASRKILLCEPYYEGGLAAAVMKTLAKKPAVLDFVGVPRKFLTNYGKAGQHDESLGLTAKKIKEKINRLINANA
jgi:transketolase